MRRYALRDDQWDRIKDLLAGREGLVGDQRVGLHGRQKMVGAGEIMGLAARSQRSRQGCPTHRPGHVGVDLGAHPAARAPDRLVRIGFCWAPALR